MDFLSGTNSISYFPRVKSDLRKKFKNFQKIPIFSHFFRTNFQSRATNHYGRTDGIENLGDRRPWCLLDIG